MSLLFFIIGIIFPVLLVVNRQIINIAKISFIKWSMINLIINIFLFSTGINFVADWYGLFISIFGIFIGTEITLIFALSVDKIFKYYNFHRYIISVFNGADNITNIQEFKIMFLNPMQRDKIPTEIQKNYADNLSCILLPFSVDGNMKYITEKLYKKSLLTRLCCVCDDVVLIQKITEILESNFNINFWWFERHFDIEILTLQDAINIYYDYFKLLKHYKE